MGLGFDPKSAWPKSPGIFLSGSCSFLSFPALWGPIRFLLVTVSNPGYRLLDNCVLPMSLSYLLLLPCVPAHHCTRLQRQSWETEAPRRGAERSSQPAMRRTTHGVGLALWAEGHETSPMMFPSPNLASLSSGPPLPARPGHLQLLSLAIPIHLSQQTSPWWGWDREGLSQG